MKERYHVTGMTCSACSSHVEKSVCKLEGIEKASVNLLTETMEVSYDEEIINTEQIVQAVEKAGYGAAPLQGGAERNGKAGNGFMGNGGSDSGMQGLGGNRGDLKAKAKEEDKSMKWRLGISIVFLLPLMYVAMHHMYSEWFGLPIPDLVRNTLHGSENAINFALTQLLLLLPILYVNRKFLSVGFKTLRHLSPNMDSLIALGASAAIGYGIVAMYRIGYGMGHGDMELVERYAHDLYFESAGMILTLITVGKYLESRSKGKTSEAITKLMDLSPKMALVLKEDEHGNLTEQEIPTERVQEGDIFLLKPGAAVPVDGVVLEGTSSIDESAITGESVPVEKQIGDKVVSATVNKAGFLKCRADRVGEDTTLAQIIRLVEEASASKAPIAKLADKVAGVFVPIVIAIALITLASWLLAGAGAEFAISSAIAVLVISCPCALGLATPVAIMVGTGVGANHGILIKSGEALQQAKEIDTVVLDKTGTITAGKLKVMQMVTVQGVSEEHLMRTAAALEKKSEHPLAEAVVEYTRNKKWELREADKFKAIFGRGVEGVLDGCKYYVGNQAYLAEQNIALMDAQTEQITALADEGLTPLLVADEKRLLGIIGVADEVKESSYEAIEAWHDMGVRVIMLTGDNKRTAEAVRRKLNLEEVVAEVLPSEKEQKIRELRKAGRRVAMIGDGINDAPALAAADVGMAIGAGTDVAMESADIVLMKSDLRDAVTAMKLSRSVIRNIKQNLFWAFFYNSIGIPLAAGVWYPLFELRLNPMFGAAAMSLSSIFVVCNALRLRGFQSGFRARAVKDAEAVTEKLEIKIEEREERSQNMTKVMTIEGMMCAHCTGRVQKVLEALEGVVEVTMSLEDKTATVVLSGEVADDILTAAVTDAGYEVNAVASI
uniref:heavy metal translocating P-type ATPase n=1 Tax=Acetatifactor sp. TaxID=1872090 RepID=UPI00405602E6